MQNLEIVIPPSQNKDASIFRGEATKSNVGFFRRAVVQKALSNLNNVLQDAAVEIGIAQHLYGGNVGYRVMNYGRVSGMGREDLSAYQIDMKKRYERWHVAMKDNPQTLEICKRFCQNEESVNSLKLDFGITERRVIIRLQYALNEYALIAGWGNQLEGSVR